MWPSVAPTTTVANAVPITIAPATQLPASTSSPAVFQLQNVAVRDPYPSFREEVGRSAPIDASALHTFRPWCPVCVEARATEDPHYRETVEERERERENKDMLESAWIFL